MKLKNKVAIVTGGSQGIGEAISLAYSKEGAIVIIANKNSPDKGAKIANIINQEGGRAEAITCDVTDEMSVNNLVSQVIQKYKRIDILVNNAGVLVCKNFEDHTVEDWNYLFDTNLKGAFLISKAIVPYMKKQKYGKILFISSVAASVGFSNVTLYSASKGGMLALVKAMVAEFISHNINVNCISPGTTDTPLNQPFITNPDFMEAIARRTVSGKAMKPSDIAGAATFLVSDDASAIHGVDLLVDNGWTTL